jgi:hypothetical protein
MNEWDDDDDPLIQRVAKQLFLNAIITRGQTPEGYISKDIYILSYIQKSPKRIFPILFWSRIV